MVSDPKFFSTWMILNKTHVSICEGKLQVTFTCDLSISVMLCWRCESLYCPSFHFLAFYCTLFKSWKKLWPCSQLDNSLRLLQWFEMTQYLSLRNITKIKIHREIIWRKSVSFLVLFNHMSYVQKSVGCFVDCLKKAFGTFPVWKVFHSSNKPFTFSRGASHNLNTNFSKVQSCHKMYAFWCMIADWRSSIVGLMEAREKLIDFLLHCDGGAKDGNRRRCLQGDFNSRGSKGVGTMGDWQRIE